MSITAIGPALDIDGPLPVAPEYSLLDVPGVRVDGDGRWENGVNVYSFPTGVPLSWEPCSTGTYRTKSDDSTQIVERFDAVGLYVPITCSSLNFGGNWRDFAARARTVLEATLSYGVEHVLSQGVVASTNPFFGDSNVTKLNGGAATLASTALAYLEHAIGLTGRQGLIHAPPEVVTQWSASSLLFVEDDVLYTFNGTPVAAGGGYIGASANGTAPGAGNAWAFATGPVQVRVSDTMLVGDDINGSLDTSNNDVTFRAEKYVLAEWDTALQSAVLVDWTP